MSWCPLGWNNRAVFGFNVNVYGGRRYDPWRAWTVVPHRGFGRGAVNINVVNVTRIDVRTRGSFVVRDAAPDSRGYAVPRSSAPIRTAVSRNGAFGGSGAVRGSRVDPGGAQGRPRRGGGVPRPRRHGLALERSRVSACGADAVPNGAIRRFRIASEHARLASERRPIAAERRAHARVRRACTGRTRSDAASCRAARRAGSDRAAPGTGRRRHRRRRTRLSATRPTAATAAPFRGASAAAPTSYEPSRTYGVQPDRSGSQPDRSPYRAPEYRAPEPSSPRAMPRAEPNTAPNTDASRHRSRQPVDGTIASGRYAIARQRRRHPRARRNRARPTAPARRAGRNDRRTAAARARAAVVSRAAAPSLAAGADR